MPVVILTGKAVIEGNAAVRRAILNSGDMELIRLFVDVPESASACTGRS